MIVTLERRRNSLRNQSYETHLYTQREEEKAYRSTSFYQSQVQALEKHACEDKKAATVYTRGKKNDFIHVRMYKLDRRAGG